MEPEVSSTVVRISCLEAWELLWEDLYRDHWTGEYDYPPWGDDGEGPYWLEA